MRYRPDIDALRAAAVVPVVLFHADLPFVQGGYVGVDVFFVISGFLISSLILAEIETGSFTLASFYQRRVLRIFPALLLVLAFCLAVGWALYLPDDFKRLCESVFAAATFTSNQYFLKDAGYFGAPAEAKPLLHTWSLAVEEQFYILFPLFMLAIARLSRRARVIAVAATWAASLALSVALVPRAPEAAFFILPTRTWELLTGTLLAMRVAPAPPSFAVARIGGWLGLALILGSVTLYHEGIAFPGLAALPPTLGAALAIWAGGRGQEGAPAPLRRPALVFVGKISYPLYLWHFPLIGFVKYASIGPPPVWALAAAVAVATLFSVASWKFVETPIRVGGRARRPAVVLALGGAAMACLAAIGLGGFFTRGFEGRLSPERLALARGMVDRSHEARACMNRAPAAVRAGELCALGANGAEASVLMWGDSFAEALAPAALAAAERAGAGLRLVGRHGCSPASDAANGLTADERACDEANAAVIDMLARRDDIRDVVLALRWPSAAARAQDRIRPDSVRPEAFAARLERLVARLRGLGKTVWIAGPLPLLDHVAPRALYIQSLGFGRAQDIRPSRRSFEAAFGWAETTLADLARHGVAIPVALTPALCSATACEVARDGRPLYFDDNHLSLAGAGLVSGAFDPVFAARPRN